jgi:hypothetical protein
VSWADVGALVNVRKTLDLAILQPIRVPERFEAVGLSVPAGENKGERKRREEEKNGCTVYLNTPIHGHHPI